MIEKNNSKKKGVFISKRIDRQKY